MAFEDIVHGGWQAELGSDTGEIEDDEGSLVLVKVAREQGFPCLMGTE